MRFIMSLLYVFDKMLFVELYEVALDYESFWGFLDFGSISLNTQL
jgi:hypothetical protein